MAQRFQNGHRRRRITIVTANTPNGSPAAAASVRSRVTVVPRLRGRAPQPRSLVQSIATKRVTGVTQPPVPGAGGTPKPLQPIWTAGLMRRKTFRNIVRPVVVKQRFVPPTKDGTPNQAVVPAPRSPARRTVRPTLVSTRPIRAVGVAFPGKPVLVPPARRVRRLNGLSLVAAFDAFEMPPPTTIRPVVVARPARRQDPRRPSVVVAREARIVVSQPPVTESIVVPRRVVRRAAPVLLLDSPYDATAQRASHLGAAIVVPRPTRTKRLRGLSMVLAFDAFETPPPLAMRPLVVPSRLKGSKAHRDAILVRAKSSLNPRALPPTESIVVPWRKPPRLAPWAISSLYRKFVEPPPEHFPLPHVRVVRAPRRAPSLWTRPIASQSIYQFPGNMVDKPWDLIAACIAWLRQDAGIVAAFGDVKGSERSQKFVSDVELPKTSPPYAVFDEPIEVENYETPGDNGLRSSVARGVFNLNVYATEKLATRQLAERVVASLNDAPLHFTDGILLYLRRSERRWRTFISPGDGKNVTLYRRELEFEYLIDRYF